MCGQGKALQPVRCSCCKDKFEETSRHKLFDDFWTVDWARKRDFVIANVAVTETQRKTAGEGSRRQNSMRYFLTNGEESVRVCKQYFLNTLNVGTVYI